MLGRFLNEELGLEAVFARDHTHDSLLAGLLMGGAIEQAGAATAEQFTNDETVDIRASHRALSG
jgi:hypothetical protein